VIDPIPNEAHRVLEEGLFCYLAARTRWGPHLTPLVYAVHSSRLWVTTSRRSVKARVWRTDPSVGGLVRAGGRAIAFVGSARTHDLLDPGTWLASARSAPAITLAAGAFTRRNARFFAGYAVDAPRIPFAWSPPGRVFTELRMDSAAVLADGIVRRWGIRKREVHGGSAFRVPRDRVHPLEGVPDDVRDRVGDAGDAALALDGPGGLWVVPARWTIDRATLYAGVAEGALGLAGGGPTLPGAIVLDHASTWRARAMEGAMVRGDAHVLVPRRLRSGRASAARLLEGMDLEPTRSVLVSMTPSRIVWWRGWSAGTVVP
jgi:hypothetical protein